MTGGHFFRAEDGTQLAEIYADIDRLAPAKLETHLMAPETAAFPVAARRCRRFGIRVVVPAADGKHISLERFASCLTQPALRVSFFAAALAARASCRLWRLLPAARARQRPESAVGRRHCADLLKHLLVEPAAGGTINPLYLVTSGLVIGIVALPGPTWRRELPPFVEDKAPLMIALALSSRWSRPMFAPTRLERAKQKMQAICSAARAGARTGLIAFSGTAHLVMPMTDDARSSSHFLRRSHTGLMPGDGNNVTCSGFAGNAVPGRESVAGTILVDRRRSSMKPQSGRQPAATASRC